MWHNLWFFFDHSWVSICSVGVEKRNEEKTAINLTFTFKGTANSRDVLLTKIGVGDVTSTHRVVSGGSRGRYGRYRGDCRGCVVVDAFVVVIIIVHLINVIFFAHGEESFVEAFGKLFLFGGSLKADGRTTIRIEVI